MSAPSRSRRLFLVGGFSILIPGSDCALAGAAPSDWIELAVGNVFVLHAPKDSQFKTRGSTDSLAGTVAGPGFSFDIDYGIYSDPLTMTERFEKWETKEALVDGRAGRLLIATVRNADAGNAHFLGLHIPNVRPSLLGNMRLTVTATATRRQQLDVMRRIIGTIRFRADDR